MAQYRVSVTILDPSTRRVLTASGNAVAVGEPGPLQDLVKTVLDRLSENTKSGIITSINVRQRGYRRAPKGSIDRLHLGLQDEDEPEEEC